MLDQIIARLQNLESLAQRALMAAIRAAAVLSGTTSIQSGTVALVAGVANNVPANITANSRILVSFNTAAGGGGLTVKLHVPSANRTVGTPGNFDIQALTSADALNAADTSTVDWLVIN